MPPASKNEIIFPALSAFVTSFIGIFMKSFLGGIISKKRYKSPSWNDKIINSGNALSNYLFIAVFFIVIGFAVSIKTGVVHKGISVMGAASIAFGLGILIPTYLTLISFRLKEDFKEGIIRSKIIKDRAKNV